MKVTNSSISSNSNWSSTGAGAGTGHGLSSRGTPCVGAPRITGDVAQIVTIHKQFQRFASLVETVTSRFWVLSVFVPSLLSFVALSTGNRFPGPILVARLIAFCTLVRRTLLFNSHKRSNFSLESFSQALKIQDLSGLTP